MSQWNPAILHFWVEAVFSEHKTPEFHISYVSRPSRSVALQYMMLHNSLQTCESWDYQGLILPLINLLTSLITDLWILWITFITSLLLQDLAITFTTLCLSTCTCLVEFENSRSFLSCWAILQLSVLVMSPKFMSQTNLISVFLSF